MRINLKGVTRIVILIGGYAIKVPKFYVQWDHFLRGILANISEHKTWAYNSGKYESGTSNLLCPVLWCSWGGWILVMKRAKEFTYKDNENLGVGGIEEHKKCFPGDDSVSNYGWLEGRLVKIDYGDLDAWASDFKRYEWQ